MSFHFLLKKCMLIVFAINIVFIDLETIILQNEHSLFILHQFFNINLLFQMKHFSNFPNIPYSLPYPMYYPPYYPPNPAYYNYIQGGLPPFHLRQQEG